MSDSIKNESIISLKDELIIREIKQSMEYCWVNDRHRIVLHLGKMRNAVVIHESLTRGKYYKIGLASFFPFTDEIYKMKIETLEEAKLIASKYILDWLTETNLALKIN